MPPDKNTCDGDDGTYNKEKRREGDDHSDRYDHLLAEIARKLLAIVVLVNASLRPPARNKCMHAARTMIASSSLLS